MKLSHCYLTAFTFSILLLFSQCSQQPYVPRDNYVTMEEIYARVEDNQYELSYNQTELNNLTQKINNQQNSLYQINQKLDLLFNEYNDLSESQQVTLKERIADLEKTNYKLIKDLNKVKTHANAVTQSVNEIYQQLNETQNLQHSLDDLYQLVRKIKGKPTYFKPFSYYTVKKGDSLETISKQHNIQLEELKRFNGLSASPLFVGQQLRIPKL